MRTTRARVGAAIVIAVALSCFGRPDYGRARTVAIAFGQALQSGDTLRMQSLSAREAAQKMSAAQREIPARFVAFPRPVPTAFERPGPGKGYVFFLPSERLRRCNGGVIILISELRGSPRVTAVRPEPSMAIDTGASSCGVLDGP